MAERFSGVELKEQIENIAVVGGQQSMIGHGREADHAGVAGKEKEAILVVPRIYLASKFLVVTKPVAHRVSVSPLIANTFASPTETDFPEDTARPRAIKDACLSG